MASSPQRLPSADTAYVEEKKITDYLLNETHPQGRSKARFFRAFGFDLERWEELSAALLKQAQLGTVVSQVALLDSTQYAVEGDIVAPDGRKPVVRSVWEVRHDDSRPRLITAYPTTIRTYP